MVCYHEGLSSIEAGTCALTSVDIERHGGPKFSPDISDESYFTIILLSDFIRTIM